MDDPEGMSLGRFCVLFLLLAVAAGAVTFTLDTPRTGLLIDVAFVTAVVCCVVCGVGHLGRRLAEAARAARSRRHADQE